MNNSQKTAERIKLKLREKGLSMKQFLSECGLGVNTVSKLANGTDVTTQTITTIADHLNCSVDYLLGRTDNPDDYSAELKEIQRILESLSVREKTELMTLIYDFADKKLMIHA